MRIDLLEIVFADLKKRNANSFDYSEVITKFDYANNCATISCIIGDLPRIFPNDWIWKTWMGDYASVALAEDSNNFESKDVCDFFQIEGDIYYALFCGNKLGTIKPIGANLEENLMADLPTVIKHWKKILSHLKTKNNETKI